MLRYYYGTNLRLGTFEKNIRFYLLFEVILFVCLYVRSSLLLWRLVECGSRGLLIFLLFSNVVGGKEGATRESFLEI